MGAALESYSQMNTIKFLRKIFLAIIVRYSSENQAGMEVDINK